MEEKVVSLAKYRPAAAKDAEQKPAARSPEPVRSVAYDVIHATWSPVVVIGICFVMYLQLRYTSLPGALAFVLIAVLAVSMLLDMLLDYIVFRVPERFKHGTNDGDWPPFIL